MIPAARAGATRYWPPPGAGRAGCGAGCAAGQRLAADVLQLGAGGHLLGEQRRLDAVEDALQPADELGLGDPQLGVRRRLALGERQGDPLQLLAQLGGQALLELADRRRVDVAQPVAAGVVQGRGADLLEQLLDHRADPHDLGRLLDHVADATRPDRPSSAPAACARAPTGWPSGPTTTTCCGRSAPFPGAVMPPSCLVPPTAGRRPGGE